MVENWKGMWAHAKERKRKTSEFANPSLKKGINLFMSAPPSRPKCLP
jgi:hypothetical protein